MTCVGMAHSSTRNRAFPLLFALLTGCFPSSSMPAAPAACANDLGSPIPNFCVVTESVLWRGAKPAQDGTAWLIQRGVRTIANLELLHDDRRVLGESRPAIAGRRELGYFRISDWEPNAVLAPAILDDHVAHFLAVVDKQPKPVYVHCRSGQNRTGVMVAAYRVIVEGLSRDAAIAEMRRYQGIWFKADSAYIRSLSSERREQIRRKAAAWMPKLKRDSRIICENGKCRVSKS
jgi:rhodanese/phosphatase family protein